MPYFMQSNLVVDGRHAWIPFAIISARSLAFCVSVADIQRISPLAGLSLINAGTVRGVWTLPHTGNPEARHPRLTSAAVREMDAPSVGTFARCSGNKLDSMIIVWECEEERPQ